MCLIALSRDGELVPRDVFDHARAVNADGIGIMAPGLGAVRHLGRGAAKRAWRCIRRLAEERRPYAVHWRMATHGAVTRANCHPLRANGGALVMHNGVLTAASRRATRDRSDTAIFVGEHMANLPSPSERGAQARYDELERRAGWGNKLVILHPSGEWTVLNEDWGHDVGSIWYSNTYSLPMDPMTTRWTRRRRASYRIYQGYDDAYDAYDEYDGWQSTRARRLADDDADTLAPTIWHSPVDDAGMCDWCGDPLVQPYRVGIYQFCDARCRHEAHYLIGA